MPASPVSTSSASPSEVRREIGLVSQKASSDPMATGRENLLLAARIQGLRRRAAATRAGELLDRFGLADAANRLVRTYSGGMARRLDVAIGLVHRPQVLFLDEPTTGLDPEARAEMWAEIERLADERTTVLLTTHYLDEADRLADRLAIVDRGRVVVEGTAEELKRELRGDAVVIDLARPRTWPRRSLDCVRCPGCGTSASDGTSLRARADHGATAVPAVLASLDEAGITVASVTVSRPSLDDVYLRHAGRAYHATEGNSTMTTLTVAPRPIRSHLLTHSGLLTLRSVRALIRQPWYAAITLVQPIIWLLLFGQLFRSVVHIPGFAASPDGSGSYLEFISPGVIMMTVLFSAAWAGTIYIEDMNRGVMDRLLASPVSRGAMMIGTLAYQVITTLIQTLWCSGSPMWPAPDTRAAVRNPAHLGCGRAAVRDLRGDVNAVALLARTQEALIGISQFLSLPLAFVSSAVMAIALAPDWLQTVARYNPVDWAVVVSRQALSADPDWGGVLPRLGCLALLAIGMAWLATRAFRTYQRSA